MKKHLLPFVALFAGATTVSAALLTFPARPASNSPVTGDYVEARTASVFAGPCHYNGELVTTGRDAIMAWNFTGGSINGVSLRGVRAMAEVTCTESLGDETASRKTELTVDSAASPAQAAAVAALLKAHCSAQLGDIVATHRATVSFTHGDTGYTVETPGFASLNVSYRPDNSCCVQPNLVWFSPLTPLEHRMVGYTEEASYSGAIADRWQREGEDSAFYGSFTL